MPLYQATFQEWLYKDSFQQPIIHPNIAVPLRLLFLAYEYGKVFRFLRLLKFPSCIPHNCLSSAVQVQNQAAEKNQRFQPLPSLEKQHYFPALFQEYNRIQKPYRREL
jgi:hypothetical protein